MPSADRSGSLYAFSRGTPRLGASVHAGTRGVRRVGDLADVTAVPVPSSDRRVQYWTFGQLEDVRDRDRFARLPVTYDLTFLAARPIGWERSKTHGHVHLGPDEQGFAELYEVLEGRAGFLVQDLESGPAARFAVVIEAEAGDTVVIPPRLHHAAVNLGSSTLVLGDLVARAARDDYGRIKDARGMSHYLATDGSARANPAYASVPHLERVRAAEWSDAPRGPLYGRLVAEPEQFDWLSETELFPDRFPRLWRKYGRSS